MKNSGLILLQSVPAGVKLQDVKHDMEKVSLTFERTTTPLLCLMTRIKIEGILGVHELHIWQLNQQKSLASAHITIDKSSMESFMSIAQTVNECLHEYGIHSTTLQPEFISVPREAFATPSSQPTLREVAQNGISACVVGCEGYSAESLSCRN